MHQPLVLLLTDIVDSTRIFSALGEVAAAHLWAQHDERARDLLLTCAAREVERGDGFLLLFDDMADAARFAQGYHALLQALDTPLTARIGIHLGPIRVRENAPDHVGRGARALDLDGQAKAITARIQSLAQARQTLASASAMAQLPNGQSAWRSHGHWQLKGVAEPMELFEIGADATRFAPPPDAEKVWRVVRSGDLWLPVREVPHSLPAERDRFVGRTEHLNRLADALEQARLVSVLGTGGTGKTRLAQRFGWARLGDFPGGVWFCDLSSAQSPDGIVHAVAQGLQLPLTGSDALQQIGDALAGRGECLVIFDNFEQVARHAEATVGHWLGRAPQARFMVTTREVLGIAGEDTLALPPLPGADGEALFRLRAQAVPAPPFAPHDEDAIPQLVKLLDGLPLAIELAASRVSVLAPQQLLARMGERFKLLTSRGGRPDRQTTLRATLDWSWDLLTDPERSVLTQLSVFEGGFTVEAAQAVVDLTEFADTGADSAAHPMLWTVDVLQALVDKSLVRRVSVQRFDLLRSIQEYAQTQVQRQHQGQETTTAMGMRRRHSRHFSMLDDEAIRADNCADLENAIAACSWAASNRDASLASRALVRAWAGLRLTGPFRTAADLATQVGQICPPASDACAKSLWVEGSARHLLGEVDEARDCLKRALLISSASASIRTRLLCTLGELESTSSNAQVAQALLDQAYAASGDNFELRCRSLNALGALAWDQMALKRAQQFFDEALQIARSHGLSRWAGGLLGNLGSLAYSQGHLSQAEASYREALPYLQITGDRRFHGNTLCNLGVVLLERGDLDEARQHLDAASSTASMLGDLRLAAVCNSNLGLWFEARGDLRSALPLHRAAVDASRQTKDPRAVGLYSIYLGRALLSQGLREQARAALSFGIDAMQSVEDTVGEALTACVLAQVEYLSGAIDESERLIQLAQLTLDLSELGPDSELAREIRLAQLRCSGAMPQSQISRD